MSKHSRSGGKFTGNHTTLIPFASQICDLIAKCELVTKITPGIINSGLRPVNGKKRVKITEEDGGVLLSIRDNVCHQKVYAYGSNVKNIMLSLAKTLRDNDVEIRFKKPVE